MTGLAMGLRESCLLCSYVCVFMHIHRGERWAADAAVCCTWDMDTGSLATDAPAEMNSCTWAAVELPAGLGFVVSWKKHEAHCPGVPSGPSWFWGVVVSLTLSLGGYRSPGAPSDSHPFLRSLALVAVRRWPVG